MAGVPLFEAGVPLFMADAAEGRVHTGTSTCSSTTFWAKSRWKRTRRLRSRYCFARTRYRPTLLSNALATQCAALEAELSMLAQQVSTGGTDLENAGTTLA
eukprot:1543247-Rhodomonas_salina.1